MVARPKPRTSLIAGAFVIAGVIGAIAIGFTLTDAVKLLDSTRRYTVRFGLDAPVTGVKPGSSVTLGGHPVGRVVGLRPAYEPVPGAPEGRPSRVPTGMLVDIRLPAEMALYDNADVRVQRPLIGTLSAINIDDPGGPGGGGDAARAALLDAGATLDGTPGGSIDAVIANASILTENLNTIMAAFAPRAETGAEDLSEALTAMRSFSQRIDRRSAPLLDEIDAAAARVRALSDRLPGLADSAEGVLTEARAGIGDARGMIDNADAFVADGRSLLDDAGADIRRTTSEAADLTARLNNELVPEYGSRFEALLDEGADVLGSADALVDELGASFRELEPQIRRTAANLRLGSNTALAFVDEVRAAPWRLLNQPGRKEQRRELLYDAARRYARAVSDLRATSASLEAAIAGLADRNSPTEPDRLVELRAQLTSAFDRYARLESDLLELLADEGLDAPALPPASSTAGERDPAAGGGAP